MSYDFAVFAGGRVMFFSSKSTKPDLTASNNKLASPDVPISQQQSDTSEGADLDPDELERRGVLAKHALASLGSIVSIMMRSPNYHKNTLRDLAQYVVPAVQTAQFSVAEVRSKKTGAIEPVAMILWATVSKEIDERLTSKPSHPIQIEVSEWKSGDCPWLIDAVGPPEILARMIRELLEDPFKGKTIKTNTIGKNGEVILRQFNEASFEKTVG